MSRGAGRSMATISTSNCFCTRRSAGDDAGLHGVRRPVLARFGKYAGTRVFAAEEEQGHALMRTLSREGRRRATVGMDLPSELLTAAFRDNQRIDAVGIRYGDLDAEGRERLESLIGLYTGRLRPGHADVRYAEGEASPSMIRCSPGSARSD